MTPSNHADESLHETGLALKLLAVFILTLVAMAVFQSASLVTLSYDLPPGGVNERVIVMAEIWHGWMTAMGAAGVTEWVGGFVETLHQQAVF